ncbi:hypothetical protein M8818_000958 [Zalaria obscura]|uniref:Uncharacterized protein n=1 Tax=Zalaria obscura TaxID=2024903 RepID=A0ACC3SNB0_9PEZI
MVGEDARRTAMIPSRLLLTTAAPTASRLPLSFMAEMSRSNRPARRTNTIQAHIKAHARLTYRAKCANTIVPTRPSRHQPSFLSAKRKYRPFTHKSRAPLRQLRASRQQPPSNAE